MRKETRPTTKAAARTSQRRTASRHHPQMGLLWRSADLLHGDPRADAGTELGLHVTAGRQRRVKPLLRPPDDPGVGGPDARCPEAGNLPPNFHRWARDQKAGFRPPYYVHPVSCCLAFPRSTYLCKTSVDKLFFFAPCPIELRTVAMKLGPVQTMFSTLYVENTVCTVHNSIGTTRNSKGEDALGHNSPTEVFHTC